MSYKIYRKGSYFYIIDTATNREYSGLFNETTVQRHAISSSTFYFNNIENWKNNKAVEIADIDDYNGDAYTTASFVAFYESSSGAGSLGTDPFTQIALGNVTGQRIFNAMGERESMGTTSTGEDIWRGAATTIPTPSAAGEQMTFVSSNDADNGATATGVLTVKMHYLDATGAEQEETITMNGTTEVDTVATDIRFVNDIYSLTVGSNGVAEGNIIVYKKGAAATIYNLIALGGNKSLVPSRMIPLGKTLILKEWHAEEAQARRVNFRIRSTDMYGVLIPGVFCFKDAIYLKQDSSSFHLNAKIPALSIIKVSGWASQAGAEGSCGWWGILVDS